MTYDDQAVDYLAKEGWPHPALRRGNRAPTIGELKCIAEPGITIDVEDAGDDIVVDWFRLRAPSYEAEVRAMVTLSRVVGQLWIYPDSGLPAIVIEPEMDIERVAQIWGASHARDDGWEWLHHQLYR